MPPRQSPEQVRESRRQGGRNSLAGRARYPKGHPKAGQLMPRGAAPPDPTPPPADPTTPPPPAAPPADPPRGRLNPLTATPRDLFDRIRGR
jgi:hypothetical protein